MVVPNKSNQFITACSNIQVVKNFATAKTDDGELPRLINLE
jgi:hypothetical protein